MSYMAERGLLQYTRGLDIRDPVISTPGILLPHLHHFQSLTRVHTLTIWFCSIFKWANHYKTGFAHFYPTLTSLTLINPFGPCRIIMQFALQFPNLENLCIKMLGVGWNPGPNSEQGGMDPTTVIIDQSPPLSGHLRLGGHSAVSGLVDLVYELPNGFNFRSIELEDFSGDCVQPILQSCAHTLEDLTIVLNDDGDDDGTCRPSSGRLLRNY